MHISCVVFAAKSLSREEVRGKRVIDVGARDVNGSLRPLIESWEPAQYVGTDIKSGPGVDVVCDAGGLADRFGEDSFDLVICTELLEHVRFWRDVVSNLKRVCTPDGVLLITTRSYGAAYHGFPYDFWRYEIDDMRTIFGDCEVLALEGDYQKPGVFLKARKPVRFGEIPLPDHRLYSMVSTQRVVDITDKDLARFLRWGAKFRVLRRLISKLLRESRAFPSRVVKFLAPGISGGIT